ncbi:L-threonylcarbamoyladenylate synthase [Bradymonas sediminis]|nr:L-threonylcarbamoyladenylate synthase [Bradymonas sediminis]TDP63553.1 L-threonylcarbamoyladenylate synthase [Bradymonas sediminis]
MKTIKSEPNSSLKSQVDEVVDVLNDGGVVCMPCGGSYRLLADLYNEQAVMNMMQAKRRIATAPSLVFVAEEKMLEQAAADVDASARPLMDKLWPGPLTIRFNASREIPKKVRKILTKATGKVGIRVPDEQLLRQVVKALGRPVLVSSANKEKKHGSASPAQIRNTFFGRISLFIDAGDLPEAPSSTVIEVKNGKIKVLREGNMSLEQIKAAL